MRRITKTRLQKKAKNAARISLVASNVEALSSTAKKTKTVPTKRSATKIFSADVFNINFSSFIDPYSLCLCVGFILVLEFIQGYHKRFNLVRYVAERPSYVRFALYAVFLVVLLNFGIFSSKGFIYFQF